MESNCSEEYVFKFVIIGDTQVGKSSISHHFMYNNCKTIIISIVKSEITHTIGVDFCSKIINISNINIKLQLWDTAGQEKYRSLAKNYYRGALGVIIIYDITK